MSDQSPAVLFIEDLARELRCSVTTIKARLAHAPHLLPPQMSRIDKRPRWYEPTVRAWMESAKPVGFAKVRRWS